MSDDSQASLPRLFLWEIVMRRGGVEENRTIRYRRRTGTKPMPGCRRGRKEAIVERQHGKTGDRRNDVRQQP